MIDLTPLEVRKKKGDFRRQMRGYDPALVDDFLDLVADRLEQLVRENLNAQEKLAALEAQVKEYREREKALTEALVSAQELREQGRRQIEKELELARRQAEQDAEQIRASAMRAREREEQNLRRLRARQSQVIQSFRQFLERELAELAVTAETLEVTNAIDDAEESALGMEERTPVAVPLKPGAPPQAAAAIPARPVVKPAAAANVPPAAEPAPVAQPKPANSPTAGPQSVPSAKPAAAPPADPNAPEPLPVQPNLAFDADLLDISDLAPAEEDDDDRIIDGGWVSLIENKRDVDG